MDHIKIRKFNKIWIWYKINYQIDIENRKKAELISDLISEWIRFSENQKELNRITLNLFL